MNKLKEQVTIVAKNVIAHWNTPAPGKYVSYKELAAYSVGGMGVQFVLAMFYQIAMAATCYLTGIIYGIKPTDMAIILNIATGVAIIFQPLKSWMIDNLKTKTGKARPWIFWLGPPTAILIIACAFISPAWDYTVIVALIGTAYVLLNIIANFYNGQYLQLAQLMTPDTDERAAVVSVSSIIYSLAPTITGFVLPLIADAFPDGWRDQTVYQISFPIFGILGLLMGYVAYFGTKEKVITSTVKADKKEKERFWVSLKKISTNRYFWIINIANIFLVFRNTATTLLAWMWVYMFQNEAVQAILVTVIGTASLIGMAIAPFMCKFLGKKYTYIISTGLMLICSLILVFCVNSVAMMIILIYIINFSAAVQIITNPAMAGEALDYQQWKTGDRMEGFSGNFSIITSLIAIGTNLVVPAIQESLGLINNYDTLFDPNVREPIFKAMCYISVAGAALNMFPYFFWNMTEKKHKAMMEEIKQRAIEEDQEAGIEETADELEARLAGITVDQLLAERERMAQAKAELDRLAEGLPQMDADLVNPIDDVLDTTDAKTVEDNAPDDKTDDKTSNDNEEEKKNED